MIMSVYEILSRVSDDVPPEALERMGRRLATAALHAMDAEYTKSLLAETIYATKLDEDWMYFLNADGQRYDSWDEFHQDLATALRIAESTSWFYQRLVRYAYEVLNVKPGDFANRGGLITVRAMERLSAGIDGRSTTSFAESVRPATVHFEKVLLNYPGNTWAERMQAFFEVALAYNYDDPSAVNLPPGEIYALVDENLGRPRIWWEWEDYPTVVIGVAIFPDQGREDIRLEVEVSGATATLLKALERALQIGG